jgi:hypothetical protein
MKYLGPNYKKYIKHQNIFPQAFCNNVCCTHLFESRTDFFYKIVDMLTVEYLVCFFNQDDDEVVESLLGSMNHAIQQIMLKLYHVYNYEFHSHFKHIIIKRLTIITDENSRKKKYFKHLIMLQILQNAIRIIYEIKVCFHRDR